MKRELGFIGLGRMGENMVLNLLSKKYKVVAYNRSPQPTKKLAKRGAVPAFSLDEVVSKLKTPRVLWLMIPAGKPVDQTINELIPLVKKGDIIIDGGNSLYKDSIRRFKALKKRGISFLDCGTSGGMEGARHGACMMIGGELKIFKKTEHIFRDMCVKDGYGYMGNPGAGHFVKGIHNGIEYGMMGALNEGFEAIKKHHKTFKTDLGVVAKVYNHGSIIESKLSNWLQKSFDTRNYLKNISCEVPKGETEKEMEHLEKISPMPVLKAARLMRVNSRRKSGLCGRYVAAMRNQFGGHKVNKK